MIGLYRRGHACCRAGNLRPGAHRHAWSTQQVRVLKQAQCRAGIVLAAEGAGSGCASCELPSIPACSSSRTVARKPLSGQAMRQQAAAVAFLCLVARVWSHNSVPGEKPGKSSMWRVARPSSANRRLVFDWQWRVDGKALCKAAPRLPPAEEPLLLIPRPLPAEETLLLTFKDGISNWDEAAAARKLQGWTACNVDPNCLPICSWSGVE